MRLKLGHHLRKELGSSPLLGCYFFTGIYQWFLYRLLLGWHLYTTPIPPLEFQRSIIPLYYFSTYFFNDIAWVFLTSFFLWGILWLSKRLRLPRAESLLAGAVLLLYATSGVIGAAHAILISQYHTTFEFSLLKTAGSVLGWDLIWNYIGRKDLLYFFLLSGGYPLIRRLTLKGVRIGAWFAVVFFWIGLAAIPQSARCPDGGIRVESNPVERALREEWRSLMRLRNGLALLKASPEQMETPEPVDPLWKQSPSPAPLQLLQGSPPPINLIVIVLESTGGHYPLEPTINGQIPMPFLAELAKHSALLRQHYSTANYSAPALFSIMTGLYPDPGRDHLFARPDIAFPMIHSFWKNHPRIFAVYPGSTEFFFPQSLFRNAHFPEFHDYRLIPNARTAHGDDQPVIHEVDAFRFFLEKVDRAPEPLLATYISLTPHYSYQDYGSEYHRYPVNPPPAGSPEALWVRQVLWPRYCNNLYLMDCALRQLYELLERQKRLEKTVFVIVGDHGEGFAQHLGSIFHGSHLYEEIVRSFAMLYAPGRIKPREVFLPTSHVDLLPTLLDVFGIPAEGRLFSGESLLKPLQRKAVFFHSLVDGHLGAVSQNLQKVVVDPQSGGVEGYDLQSDPQEIRPLATPDPQLTKAVWMFQNSQRTILENYNHKSGRRPVQ